MTQRPVDQQRPPAFISAAAARARQALWALAAAAVAALGLGLPAGLKPLEERSRDNLTARIQSVTAAPEIVVVDISEESLQRLGTWPWTRGQLADLVEELLGPLGARAVALDMVLPDQADPAGDARLASIATHGPLTLAHVLDFSPRPAPITMGRPAGGTPASGRWRKAGSFVANHGGLEKARCVGHIGVEPDADGVLRRVHLRAEAAGRDYSTLSLALLQCADPALAARATDRLRGVRNGIWRVPFRRGLDAFATVSAEMVLAGEVDRSSVQGRYVLIGSSAVGLSDYIATPVQPVTAGVHVHAQVLAELLDHSEQPHWLPSPVALGAVGTLAALALLGAGLLHSVRVGLITLVLASAAWLALASWAFSHSLGLPVLPPLAAFSAFTGAWIGVDFAESRRLSRQALHTLSHYVAQPVLKLLVKQGLQRSLAPSRREITVLVADMAGYTRLTAESTLEESARLTTEFLEAITQPVLSRGGTLDRYTGDGLIAFWGAPLALDDHAQRAHEAALEMLTAVAALNTIRLARGEPALSVRIGMESGQALVGDLGSSTRSVYTAVGTCINLASRLQEIAREMGEVLVVGPRARDNIRAGLHPLGPRAVRGMPHPIELYGLRPEPGRDG